MIDGTPNKIFIISVISIVASALALLYFFVDARHYGFFPRCPFFVLTRLYCPGCGSQRAASALLHCDVTNAVHYNIMFVASMPFVLYSASVAFINLFKTSPIIQKVFYSPLFAKGLLFVVVLFWILRNIPVYPFTLLAPLHQE